MKEYPIKLIITAKDYFDSVRFFEKTEIEKIAYMLYYVTKVARLRPDMQPQIITDRINDQIKQEIKDFGTYGINPQALKEDAVKDIMRRNTEYFQVSNVGDTDSDRKNKKDKTAYQLTGEITDKFDKEFNKKLKTVYKKRAIFEKIWVLAIALSLCIITVSIYCHYYNETNRRGLSLPEFRERMKFDSETDENKALYFLFYITEIEKLKKEMSPDVISERLYDIANSKITGEEIKNYFDKSDEVTESKIDGMYRIESQARQALSKKAGIKLDYTNKNFFEILAESVWLKLFTTFAILGAIFVGVFSIGYSLGKKISLPD